MPAESGELIPVKNHAFAWKSAEKYLVIKGRLLKTREAILVLIYGEKMKKETKGERNERGGKRRRKKWNYYVEGNVKKKGEKRGEET